MMCRTFIAFCSNSSFSSLNLSFSSLKIKPKNEPPPTAQGNDQLRLLHVDSGTVFSNWPTERTPLRKIQCVAFSPGGAFLAGTVGIMYYYTYYVACVMYYYCCCCLSECLFCCVFVCLSVCLSVCMSACLSVCLLSLSLFIDRDRWKILSCMRFSFCVCIPSRHV